MRNITFQNAEDITEEGLPLVLLFYNPAKPDITVRYAKFVADYLMPERSECSGVLSVLVRLSLSVSVPVCVRMSDSRVCVCACLCVGVCVCLHAVYNAWCCHCRCSCRRVLAAHRCHGTAWHCYIIIINIALSYSSTESVNFVYADGAKFAHPLTHLGKSENDLPLIAIDSFQHMFLVPQDIESSLK